ncbi:ATP-binding domain-containing protein [Nannocystis pusilla]|uniref:ATP-binding domain-containing protein n=1 Tax=Nannocystis pusilla TaxID=889268 RepID=UPI003B780969
MLWVVSWSDADDLQRKLFAELARELELGDPGREAVRATDRWDPLEKNGQIYFWSGRDGQLGAASAVDDWQILNPVRGTLHGADALNRAIQERFRTRVRAIAAPTVFYRAKIPPPMGVQGILWGDKVINLQNNARRRTYPESPEAYLANGEMGVVVGEYKTMNSERLPKHLEVEFSSYPGVTFKFWNSEFSGEDASPQLELAYVLTVHKTQGSEFARTFVVIPNPCRPLSRELLYTALTRHQQRVVLFHQGPVSALRHFSSEHTSEVAQRLTNLFAEATPRRSRSTSERAFSRMGSYTATRTECSCAPSRSYSSLARSPAVRSNTRTKRRSYSGTGECGTRILRLWTTSRALASTGSTSGCSTCRRTRSAGDASWISIARTGSFATKKVGVPTGRSSSRATSRAVASTPEPSIDAST